MTEDGDSDEAKVTELIAEFQNPDWDAEWKRVLPICKPVGKRKSLLRSNCRPKDVQWVTKVMTPASIRNIWKQKS